MTHPLPTEYRRVTQSFGVANDEYISGIHMGTDYSCPIGTPIYAPCDGKVYHRIVDNPSMGNAVYFAFEWEGKKYWMRSLHMSEIKPLGEYREGQVIGRTGNTGKSEGSHWHVDIWTRPIEAIYLYSRAGVLRNLVDPEEMFKDAL